MTRKIPRTEDVETGQKVKKPLPTELTSFPKVVPQPTQPELIQALNVLLANEYAVFTKTLNYHWNVKGPRFHSVHGFLEDHYKELLEVIDEVAERIRKLGGRPNGTLTELTDKNFLTERPGVYPPTNEMIADLMTDHQAISSQIKAILNELIKPDIDPGTDDFMSSLIAKHENFTWQLKSHLA